MVAADSNDDVMHFTSGRCRLLYPWGPFGTQPWGRARMQVPKKYWWTAAAVPIVVALIGAAPMMLNGSDEGVLYRDFGHESISETAGRDINNFHGATQQFSGDVAFTSLNLVMAAHGTEKMSPDVVELVKRAIEAVQEDEVARAIPLLEAAAEAAPNAGILNNLGAAYLAAGEPERAADLLAAAKEDAKGHPELLAAVQHNLYELAAAQRPAGPSAPTEWSGVIASLVRLEETGGYTTVELALQNAGDGNPMVCPGLGRSYLIDEASGETWPAAHASESSCRNLAPGEERIVWAKFPLPGDPPPRVTAVIHGVERPFENVPLD